MSAHEYATVGLWLDILVERASELELELELELDPDVDAEAVSQSCAAAVH